MLVIVLGASGFIGGHLFSELQQRGYNLIGTQHSGDDHRFVSFDLLQDGVDQLEVEISEQTVLIVASSITDTAFCQNHPEESWALNVIHTLRLIEAVAQREGRILFLSSDYAVEDDRQQRPLLNYGKQKRAVEAGIEECCASYAIVRPGKVYSLDPSEGSFLTEMCRKIQCDEPQKVLVDQLFSPIFIDDLVGALIQIATDDKSGVFNLPGKALVSRAELALLACKRLGKGRESLQMVLRSEIGLECYPRYIPLGSDWEWQKMSLFDALAIACERVEAECS
ncbi:MAG: sugar nucleotide-binding protein [Gammaproteobacteria bacterium]|jgi:dTDP-4-dehydrorhamnose reductase|nr:sugar nucleotide-binding protein [Gammaproteobacteria bacterium]